MYPNPDDTVFESILSCKREFVGYSINSCELNYYIQNITAGKGLLELDNKQIYELVDHLKECLALAKDDKDLVKSRISQVVNEYIGVK